MLRRLGITGLVCVTVVWSRPVFATSIVFSDFGPGDSYNVNVGYTVSSAGNLFNTNQDIDIAMGFTPTADYTLDSIKLAAAVASGSPNEFDVWLTTDSVGRPGTILESWVFSNAMGLFGQSNPTLAANSILHPTLNANTLYWLVADVPDASSLSAAWNVNSIGENGPTSYRVNDGTWSAAFSNTQSAFEIDGTPVPEPATLMLFGSGLLGIVHRRHRRTR